MGRSRSPYSWHSEERRKGLIDRAAHGAAGCRLNIRITHIGVIEPLNSGRYSHQDHGMVRCRDLEARDPCRLGPGRGRGRAGPGNNHYAAADSPAGFARPAAIAARCRSVVGGALPVARLAVATPAEPPRRPGPDRASNSVPAGPGRPAVGHDPRFRRWLRVIAARASPGRAVWKQLARRPNMSLAVARQFLCYWQPYKCISRDR